MTIIIISGIIVIIEGESKGQSTVSNSACLTDTSIRAKEKAYNVRTTKKTGDERPNLSILIEQLWDSDLLKTAPSGTTPL